MAWRIIESKNSPFYPFQSSWSLLIKLSFLEKISNNLQSNIVSWLKRLFNLSEKVLILQTLYALQDLLFKDSIESSRVNQKIFTLFLQLLKEIRWPLRLPSFPTLMFLTLFVEIRKKRSQREKRKSAKRNILSFNCWSNERGFIWLGTNK